MNIALIANDNKKILMENLCVSYKYILLKNELYATESTGRLVEETSNLKVTKSLPGNLGGDRQICTLITHGMIDMVIFLRDPFLEGTVETNGDAVLKLCDFHNIPIATNLASAEILIMALSRGDLDWRNIKR